MDGSGRGSQGAPGSVAAVACSWSSSRHASGGHLVCSALVVATLTLAVCSSACVQTQNEHRPAAQALADLRATAEAGDATAQRILGGMYVTGVGVPQDDAEAGRCCTNPHWPARCQPTGFSPADAIRHWSAEGGHPIQDLTAEDDLTPLPGWAPGAKTISDDGLVAEERVLHSALTMVP